MKQLIQNLKSGKMDIQEVPSPSILPGNILVRVHYSLISAGTEGSRVKTARASLIGKAKERPDQVKQVIESVKSDGLSATYQKVMTKLDSPSPMGYSASGTVIGIGSDIRDIAIGDRVACGGAQAGHAEIISVPRNLCVKMPEKLTFEHAAYTTVGAIAMQGIRQADLRLGETAVIIGLGLIGQLTVQMLKASGVHTIGIDLDKNAVELAKKSGCTAALLRNDPGIEDAVLNISSGIGADSVIITAGTASNDPVELAGRLLRKKGSVVIVGAVPTGFSRDLYYKKELELKMSCSYGPGRYDSNYEDKGIDYPAGYVRWTENRNMQAFTELASSGSIDIELLTSHIFEFDNAVSAYDMIMNHSEAFTGILLKYDIDRKISDKKAFKEHKATGSKASVGFIGAGSFAQKFLIPNIKTAELRGVATGSGYNAKNIADKFGFNFCTGEADSIINDKDINTVFIATRHNLHYENTLKALEQGKHVFVEKPLCMNEAELESIKKAYSSGSSLLMVGYNRRFSPFTDYAMKSLSAHGNKSILYRINAGNVPSDSWVQDIETGGGRIIGEVCHFIDLCMFIANDIPDRVSAFVMKDAQNMDDTLTVNLHFRNGSIANIAYYANGSKKLHKEYIEIYSSGITAVIDDFRKALIYSGSVRKTSGTQDKGHKNEVARFIDAVNTGSESPISFEHVYYSTLATFKVIESIRTNSTVEING